MAVPKYFEIHKPVLELLRDGKILTLKEMRTELSKVLELTKEDLAEKLPSGRQSVFNNRFGWARTYLKKAGLIESPQKASFVITKTGLKVLQDNPPVIDRAYL